MKSSTCSSLVIAFLWLSACQKDDAPSVSVSAKDGCSVDEVVAQAAALAPVPLSSDDRVMDASLAEVDTSRYKEVGPFSTTAPMAKVFAHRYVILTPSEGYDNGAYLCDVYVATAEVTLPAEALLVSANATPEGYTTY